MKLPISAPWRLRWCILVAGVTVFAYAGSVAPRFAPDPAAPPGYSTERAIKKAFNSGELVKTRVNFLDLAQVEIIPNLRYADDSLRNVLDIYRPRGYSGIVPAGKSPMILLVHGGAWDHGDKKSLAAYALHFAKRGYICASMNYRLSDQAVHPAAVDDVRAAVDWLRANATTYSGDPDRLALVGYSAGAQLAMLCAYAQPAPPGVRCVVDMYGPTDLTADYAKRMKAVRALIGGTYRELPEKYLEASPITHVRGGLPPTLIMHGDIDDVVPIEQAEVFARALHANGVRYEYRRLGGWDHAPDRAASVFGYCANVMEIFFRDVLGR